MSIVNTPLASLDRATLQGGRLRTSVLAVAVGRDATVTATPGHVPEGFLEVFCVTHPAALHPPGPGACAPGPASRNRIPGCAPRQTQRVRTARPVAVVAAPLIFPDGPYAQEIKSLLLYQRRPSPRDLPLRRRSFFRIGQTTNGLTVRRSTAEAERTGLEPAPPGCSWVRIPLEPDGAQFCGKCHTAAAILMDGCMSCLNCGDSKCGPTERDSNPRTWCMHAPRRRSAASPELPNEELN